MPFFSVGFVRYASPRPSYVSECGIGVIEWPVSALGFDEWTVSVNVWREWPVRALWQREDGMICGCDNGACIPTGNVCAPAGDDVRVLFSVYDTDGDEYDISGASEIVFMVADERGGLVRIVKRLTNDEIILSTNGYQFVVILDDTDTNAPIKKSNYYEVRVTSDAGEQKTVSVGSYTATRTMIKDLP